MSDSAFIEQLVAALGGRPRSGGGWLCHCPAHDDRNPSLSIDLGDNDTPLLKCFAGCSQEAVLDALRQRDLWHTGQTGQPLTEAEVKKIRQMGQQRQEKDRQRHADAAALAQAIWKAAKAVEPDHPYLSRKQVQPTDTLREIDLEVLVEIIKYHPQAGGEQFAAGRILLVPIKLGGIISSLEMIDSTGRKSALAGGRKSGGFWATEKLPDSGGDGLRLLLGEGVATVLAAKEAAGCVGVAALACGNLLSVAKQMRGEYPEAEIVVLADLVKGTGKPDHNAIKAAEAIGGKLAVPAFGPDRPEVATDFNDLAVLKGLDGVRRQIEAADFVTDAGNQPGSILDSLSRKKIQPISLEKFLSLEFPPRENLISPWLPSQGLAMVYAARGIGKTHFALGVAYAVASGGSFLGWQAPRPAGVLYLDGEMPGVVMQERLAAIIASNDTQPSAPFTLLTPDLQREGMPRIDTEEGQQMIEDVLTDDIRLIVVDNISTLARAKENEADGWTPIQEWALRQRAMGRSVLFVHHSGKGGQQRGTSRREDVLDTVIALRRPMDYHPDQGAVFEIHFEKARGIYGDNVKSIEASLKTDNAGRMTWVTRTVEAGTFDRVVQMLNEGMTQSEIAAELQLNKSNVSRHARRAKAEGLVNIPGEGKQRR